MLDLFNVNDNDTYTFFFIGLITIVYITQQRTKTYKFTPISIKKPLTNNKRKYEYSLKNNTDTIGKITNIEIILVGIRYNTGKLLHSNGRSKFQA